MDITFNTTELMKNRNKYLTQKSHYDYKTIFEEKILKIKKETDKDKLLQTLGTYKESMINKEKMLYQRELELKKDDVNVDLVKNEIAILQSGLKEAYLLSNEIMRRLLELSPPKSEVKKRKKSAWDVLFSKS